MSYRWVVIIGLFSAVSSTAMWVSYSVGIMLPDMKAELHMSPAEAGVLGAISWLAMILLGIPIAAFVSRFNPRTMIFASAIHMAVFAFLQGWAPTYELEVLFRFVFMMGFVSRQANSAMLIQQWFAQHEVPRVQSFITVVMGLAQIAAVGFLPWMLIWFDGWRNTFYALAVILVASSLFWLFFSRDNPEHEARRPATKGERERTPLAAILRYQPVWTFGVATAFCIVGTSAFSVFWPTFLTEERGMSLRMAGFFTAGIPVGQILGALHCSWIRSRVTARRQQMYLTGVVCTASMLVMSLVPFRPLLPLGAFGLGWACMQVYPTLVAIPFELPHVRPREVAVISAFMMSLFTLGGVIGPLLTGAVQQATGSLQTGLLVVSCIHLGIFMVVFASEVELPLLPRLARRQAVLAGAEHA